jgi:ABC-type glutathione transport system ATPase component
VTEVITVQSLSLAVRREGRAPRRLLDELSLTLKAGEVALLLGASGAGKTTLLHALMNEAPTGGVIVHGTGSLPCMAALGAVLLPQDPAAAMDPRQSAMDLVKEVLPVGSPRSAEQLLESMEVPREFWSARAASLSVGLAQRVQLAAVVGMEPRWLLLDEPTSALDRMRTRTVARELSRLVQRGTGLVVATHDLFLAGLLGGSTHVLSEGRVVAAGDFQTLLEAAEHPDVVSILSAARGERSR